MVNSNYTNCLEINYEKIENIKSYSHRKTDITGAYFEHYYCYNNASKVLDHITIAGDITTDEDGGGGSSLSSASSSSSSYGPHPGGDGGAVQSEKLDNKQATVLNSLSTQVINPMQITQDNTGQNASESETLLKKLFPWIKDISEDLQPHILSSFSIQQLLKFLEATLNPNKFIEDQLSSQDLQEKFEAEHQLYRFGNYTSAQEVHAQSNIDAPVSLDEYSGERLNCGILLDTLLKPNFNLDAFYLFGDLGQVVSM